LSVLGNPYFFSGAAPMIRLLRQRRPIERAKVHPMHHSTPIPNRCTRFRCLRYAVRRPFSDRARGSPAARQRTRVFATLAHEAARVHLVAEPHGDTGVSTRRFCRRYGQRARLCDRRVGPHARCRGSPPPVRCIPHPRTLPGCARRARRHRAAPRWILSNGTLAMLNPSCNMRDSPRSSTVCSRWTPPASTSPPRASINSPSTGCGSRRRGSASCRRMVGCDRRQGVRLHRFLDQSDGRAGGPPRSGARPNHFHARRSAAAAGVSGSTRASRVAARALRHVLAPLISMTGR